MTFRSIAAIIFIFAFWIPLLFFLGRAIPHLLRELLFYYREKWDFKKDSGKPSIGQDLMAARFYFLPIGIVKVLTLVNLVGMFCMVLSWLVEGFVYRYNHFGWQGVFL